MSLAYYWDEPEEKVYWFCYCEDCGWESEMVRERDDLMQTECASCKSENLRDERTYE